MLEYEEMVRHILDYRVFVRHIYYRLFPPFRFSNPHDPTAGADFAYTRGPHTPGAVRLSQWAMSASVSGQ